MIHVEFPQCKFLPGHVSAGIVGVDSSTIMRFLSIIIRSEWDDSPICYQRCNGLVIFLAPEQNRSSATFAEGASPPRQGSLTIAFTCTDIESQSIPISLRVVS